MTNDLDASPRKIHSFTALCSLFGESFVTECRDLEFEEICEKVTNWMVKKFKLYHSDAINQGYCFIWAYLVEALTNEDVDWFTNEDHVALLRHADDAFYDACNWAGCEDIEDVFVCGNTPCRVTRNHAIHFWANVGFHDRKFRQIVKRLEPDNIFARLGRCRWDDSMTIDRSATILCRALNKRLAKAEKDAVCA